MAVEQKRRDYASPLVMELGDITELTLGDPVASMDANV